LSKKILKNEGKKENLSAQGKELTAHAWAAEGKVNDRLEK